MSGRTTWTIHNVTDPERPTYVGHYTGWADAPYGVSRALAMAEGRLLGLRTEWPKDRFALSREDRGYPVGREPISEARLREVLVASVARARAARDAEGNAG